MKVALLDVFGTLLRLARWQQPLAPLLAGLNLPAEERSALREALMTTPLPRIPDVVSLLSRRYPALPLPSAEAIQAASTALTVHVEGCSVIPGAYETLDHLRDRGYRLALITNLSTFYAPLLATHGLLERVDVAVLSCEVGLVKPDPRIFHLALSRLGATPADAVMIGDRLRSDVGGAKAAGIRAIWLHSTRGDAASIADVPGMLP